MPPGIARRRPANYEAWVPVDLADQLTELIRATSPARSGAGWQVDV